MRPYDEYRQFTPIQKGHSQYNRQQKNSESRELRAGDHDHVLILNASLTWTDKRFVLVYPYLSHSAQIQIFHNLSMFAM